MDKSTETLGFGHCLHLSFSGLLATPRLTGKRNAEPSGVSVRFPSLSPPALVIDAVKSTLWSRPAFSVPTSLCQPFPSLFCPPSLLPGLLEAGLPARPPGFLSPEAAQILVATRKSRGCTGGQVPQDSRIHLCSEQQEFAGPEERPAVNCFCAKKPWIRGQVFPEPSQCPHVCLG